MANHKSALKRHRQSLKRNARNRTVKTRVKNVVKSVHTAIAENDAERVLATMRAATSTLDKAATKNVIHARKAARKISRLQHHVDKFLKAQAEA